MDTQVRTPQVVFMQPQRLIVPLFQRPYVWNEENQWRPLWNDVLRVAERLLAAGELKIQPHFLGAVVLQQLQNPVGTLQGWTVIDGQQRLTTLQLLLDALQGELQSVGAMQPAKRLEALVANPDAFCEKEEDRFKIWPTNRDRPAFNAVMGAETPVDYEALADGSSKMVAAHRYFAEQAREWLALNGDEDVLLRAEKLEHVVRELLQIVVIDLTADENAQEIFETLNARGAQLTAADLIKNLVFQRLLEQGVDVEAAYEHHWKQFETGFWETEMSFGRLKYSRSSIFLNHLLIARTGEEIVAREVFSRFKFYADFEAESSMAELLAEMDRGSAVYREFIEGATALNPINRLQLFSYRTSSLESDAFKPAILWALDPEREPVPDDQFHKMLDVIESWLVRRMLIRATTSSYSQIAAELIKHLEKEDRNTAGDATERFFADQKTTNRYWPDDIEVTNELTSLMAYRRLRRPRLRMVLEAVEDHLRGWHGENEGLGGERVARGKYHIEHVMPVGWSEKNWPLEADSADDRDRAIQTLGDLTLLTQRLNSKVSNSAWQSKRPNLVEHDVLKLNQRLLELAGDSWNEAKVRSRTKDMIEVILEIWPVPEGHVTGFGQSTPKSSPRVTLADLISAGLLDSGMTIYARPGFDSRTATLLPDGRLDVDGATYDSPSGAAKAVTGKSTNGWWFWRLEPGSRRSLSDLLQQYVDQTSSDVEEEFDDEDDSDEGEDSFPSQAQLDIPNEPDSESGVVVDD